MLDHLPGCFWNRAEPSIDGDEGACCTCGTYEHAMLEAMARAAWRDYSGERGPVPTNHRSHDWQTCRLFRRWAVGVERLETDALVYGKGLRRGSR